MGWFAWFALIVVVAGRAHQPDADVIRNSVAEIAHAVQSRQISGAMSLIADDFTGNDGDVDRTELSRLLRVQVLGRTGLTVSVGAIDVELAGDRSTARFDATLTDNSGRWLIDHRQVLHLVTGWRRDGGTWRCYNATWSDGGH